MEIVAKTVYNNTSHLAAKNAALKSFLLQDNKVAPLVPGKKKKKEIMDADSDAGEPYNSKHEGEDDEFDGDNNDVGGDDNDDDDDDGGDKWKMVGQM